MSSSSASRPSSSEAATSAGGVLGASIPASMSVAAVWRTDLKSFERAFAGAATT
jgi:hypothetical protein